MTQTKQVQETAAPPLTVLRIEGVTKSFGPTVALRDCSFELRAGEVHALMGENGSGKSTLVKILSGVHRPDGGQVLIGETPLRALSPRAAAAAGVATVFQEVQCVPAQSVLDNLWLGTDGILRRGRPGPGRTGTGGTGTGGTGTGDRRRRAGAVLAELLGGEPAHALLSAPAGSLSLSERQAVAIGRALLRSPKVLILDEATSALDVATRDRLFAAVRRRCASGAAVLFISHRMDEVTEIADRVTVLRSGESVATLDRAEAKIGRLVELMTGGEHLVQPEAAALRLDAPALLPDAPALLPGGPALLPGATVVLPAAGLGLRAGEIVGLAGLEGQGQDEYLRALRQAGGTGQVGGTVRIAYVARDRREESIFPPLSIRENFTAATLREDVRGGLISVRRAAARFAGYVDRLKIRLGRDHDAITTLSGGNQQKVVIARALALRPQVLLLNDPTRGVDIGAKRDIYALLRELAADGLAIVMLSTEVDEHLELMDRVLVFRDGAPAAELRRAELTRAVIVREFFGPDEQAQGQAHEPGEPAPATTTTTAYPARPAPPAIWPRPAPRGWRGRLPQDRAWELPAVLAVALLIANFAAQHSLLSWSAWPVTFAELATPALLAMASAPAILGGGIDISVAPLFTLASVVIEVMLLGHGITSAFVVIPVAVAVGALIGLLNGLLVNYGRYQAVVATLCMNFILSGFALGYAPAPVSGTTGWLTSLGATVGGVPGGLILLAVPLLAWWGLNRTPFVRTLLAVGGSETTAYTAGVNVAAVRTLAYTFGGAIAGLAGVAIVAQLHQAEADAGFVTPFILLAIAAVAIGGNSLGGGRGGLAGALLGAVVIFLIENLLGAVGLSSFWSQAVYGATLILAVVFASLSSRPGGRPPVPPGGRAGGPDRKNRDLIRPARADEEARAIPVPPGVRADEELRAIPVPPGVRADEELRAAPAPPSVGTVDPDNSKKRARTDYAGYFRPPWGPKVSPIRAERGPRPDNSNKRASATGEGESSGDAGRDGIEDEEAGR
jgi:ABC-type sugar transport system ATPase subunit/ribose/xylose/arabinose/galactoside ABC-type transport system permease subunit